MNGKSKNEKKILLIISLVCLMVFTIYNNVSLNYKKEYFDYYVDDIYKMHKYDVESAISELLQSQEFKSMLDSEQVISMKHLLNRYESSGEIKNLYYSDTHKKFSFELKSGTLSGVMMKEFDPYLN